MKASSSFAAFAPCLTSGALQSDAIGIVCIIKTLISLLDRSMLGLKRISELLKISADSLEAQSSVATGKAADETAKVIRELRDAAREILTSQEYQNSKIKF
jgi:hypothetical protein